MTRENGMSPSETLFFMETPGLVPLYLALSGLILGVSTGCDVTVQRSQVSFRAPRPFAWIWLPPRRHIRGRPEEYLILSFTSKSVITGPLIAQCVMIRLELYTCHTILSREEQIGNELAGWIRSSFALRNQAAGSRKTGQKA